MKAFVALTFLHFIVQVVPANEECHRKLHKTSKWRISSTEKSEEDSSSARQNYTHEVESAINKQINTELYASYTYLSMAHHFDRDDLHLPGFHNFFIHSHEEENKHAQMLMKYQNMRGGRIRLEHIEKPCKDEWGTGLDAMKMALKLEKQVNADLFDLHAVAEAHKDHQLLDFIEGNFLREQVESIKEIANFVNTLTRISGNPLGEYQFDKVTLAAK